MKSILKTSVTILMICFVITLVNCEKDDVDLSSTINEEAKFVVKEYSFKTAKEKPKFNNSYFKVTQGIKKRIKEKGSYSERSTSDFTVDTTSVKEIEVDGITTYTMLITSEEQENNSFENLIIEIDSTEEVKAYLITYYPTSMNYVEAHDSYSFQGEQSIERIDYDASFLNFNMLDTECTATLMCSWGGSDHAAGANCTASFMYTVTECNDSGGSSSTGSGNNDPGDTTGDGFSDTPNNENSGATSGSSGPYTSTVSPKEEDYETQIINCLGDYILNGNTTIQPWLNNAGPNDKNVKAVATYLKNNSPDDFTCPSDEILDFAVEAIEALMEKVCPGSFEFTDVGSNWQTAGLSNVNIQFLTIGTVIGMSNVHFSELYIGFPKISPLVGGYLTNDNAKYEAEEVFTQAEYLTDLFQSANPTATSYQLKEYFYEQLGELCGAKGGTVSTSAPLGWTGMIKDHEAYIISQTLECD